MTLDPIIKAKMEVYREDYLLGELSEDELFERYVNDNILSQLQPDVFKTEYELLDKICIGGGNDLGIDGIAITLNGQFIKSIDDIEDLVGEKNRAQFELVFIQSKNKKSFELGEYMKFLSGVEMFLQDTINAPFNENIQAWHDIYLYVMADDVIIRWRDKPRIRVFYVVNGEWKGSLHMEAQSREVHNRLEQQRNFSSIDISIIDNKKFIDILDVNENNYEFVMNLVDSMPLPEVANVDSSSVVMCTAVELVKLLTTNDGLLRRNIFEDNVRDYQDDTTVNHEIHETIMRSPEKFVLLNNGITIVCDEIKEMNRKISIRNPQVVNGCQTCNVLFQAYKEKADLDNIYVVLKVIGTADGDIVNSIVKGTNRQNIVYEVAFEITREFHKMLEKYFMTQTSEGIERIYYERRAKQYDNSSQVKPYQRVNFRILIQSIITIFLYHAELGHKHESILLQDFSNQIFNDDQSFVPYYVSSYIYLYIEKLFRIKIIDKKLYPYKMQIMLIFKELIGGASPDINKKKEIEKYCNEIMKVLLDKQACDEYVRQTVETFNDISEKWVSEKGDTYRDNRKDNADFTKYIISQIEQEKSIVESKNRGYILNVGTDSHGMYYGFIKATPQNIFFHESDNPEIDLHYEGAKVSYDIKQGKRGRQAINLTIINEE